MEQNLGEEHFRKEDTCGAFEAGKLVLSEDSETSVAELSKWESNSR